MEHNAFQDLANEACSELREDFLLFVNKGEANQDYETHLDYCQQRSTAVGKAFERSAAQFENLAKTLRLDRALAVRKFELTREQVAQVSEWLNNHKQTCPYLGPQTAGWFGSPISYNFRPHGLGTNAEVSCNCGEKIDVTDSDNW